MKQLVSFLHIFCISATWVLARQEWIPFNWGIFLLSTGTISGILISVNSAGLTFHEAKQSKLRMALYGASIVLVAFCLLSALRVIPVIPADPRVLVSLTRPQVLLCGAVVCTAFLLTFANLAFVIRDMGRRQRGLPLY